MLTIFLDSESLEKMTNNNYLNKLLSLKGDLFTFFVQDILHQ